jgi:uncharacterized protein
MREQITIEGLSSDQAAELLPDGLILLGYRGSIAHGMYVPKNDPNSIDDIDLMGVFIAPLEHYLGFGRNDVKEKFVGEWDVVSYEIRKFIGLLLKGNPNVLGMLWLPDRHLIHISPIGRRLIEARDFFVSKQAHHSFTGYAHGQLKRMTHFNQEIRDKMAALEVEISAAGVDLQKLNATQEQRDLLGESLKTYEQLRTKYYAGGYMGQKRKELVQKFGYDAKNAAHLIRLLRMGIEFLLLGELIVERPDAKELLEIKRGGWSLDQVTAEADRLFALAEAAYKKSNLPEMPEREKAERLCVELILEYHAAS